MYWKIFGEGASQILVSKCFEKDEDGNIPLLVFQQWADSKLRLTLNFHFEDIEDRDREFFNIDRIAAMVIISDAIKEAKEQEE